MKYQIIGKNIDVTEGIRAAIEKKLSRMDKYFIIDEDVTCRAVVRAYSSGAKVEITIFTKMMDLRAEVVDADLYAAVDKAIDKLEGQMRKLKTRMNRRNTRTSLGKAIAFENIKDEEVAEDNQQVVRTKSVFLSPMSIDEAVTRMEALDHDFFVYLDNEDDKISILYHRHDGGYGLIQVENEVK